MLLRSDKLSRFLSLITKEENCILLWTGKPDKENKHSLFFSHPQDIITCFKLEEVNSCFEKIQVYLKKGFFIAGYLTYESGFAFEEILRKPIDCHYPLIWFGVYRNPLILHSKDLLNTKARLNNGYNLKPVGFSIDEDRYKLNVEKIKDYIARGETYQINYTIKKFFNFSGNPYKLFFQLSKNQEAAYCAFIKNKFEYILSFSPELFLRAKFGQITTRPMKGTIDRGRATLEDCAHALALRDSLKDKAENVMIVDLLRNDLGRISQIGSVRTKSLFDVERLNTLWQMTSTITSRLKGNLTWAKVFENVFPSGSVTGAPKIRTMEIIRELEASPRGIYTGSIGYISPHKSSVFNVAIRTLRIDRKNNKCELGIGSGIVWDSDPGKEWQECQLKSSFVDDKFCDFQLIETIALRAGKIPLLDYHLERLEESAYYFDFCFEKKHILFEIEKAKEETDKRFDYKLRLLLSKAGRLSLTCKKISKFQRQNLKIRFSQVRTDSGNVYLYHKTTRRHMYDSEHRQARKMGYFDCIFKNEANQVTEGAISNIFIERDSKLYTPSVSCGLLNGVYRRFLLANANVKECVLMPQDLYSANKVFIANAISGIIPVELERK
ncbi:MAG: aminodeoxychorismate synthase component I [Candidatus Omnitrophota bacterium]